MNQQQQQQQHLLEKYGEILFLIFSPFFAFFASLELRTTLVFLCVCRVCSVFFLNQTTTQMKQFTHVTRPPPNSSPGEPQQQQRVYKKVNKRANKKVKRES